MLDSNCDAGKICVGGACIAGCNDGHPCAAPDSCCAGSCFDLSTDLDHCGTCDNACPTPQHAGIACSNGCVVGQCDAGFFDCDGDTANGCESATQCVCNPGEQQACYTGPVGTENVGQCKSGSRTCNATGDGYGPCIGQTLPDVEACGDGIDHDCNGTPNDVIDHDGDGLTICGGDCCDEPGQCGTADPKLVNPGAFEVPNDGIDNDCDPATPDTGVVCSAAAKFTGVTALDIAQAMDICQMATGGKWGIVSASQLFANGATPNATELAQFQNEQNAVVANFGNTIVPKKNSTMAVISSGKARDQNDPGWVSPATLYTSFIAFPGAGPLATYLGAHGGALLPGHCGAMTCAVGSGAYDSTDIRLQIKVPTNAKSFSYDFRFFSAEYQSWQCTQYNDYYLAILTSGAAGIPADHNISFDSQNNPVSVNNGFFQVCGGNGKNCGTCPSGTGPLAGTGFDTLSGGGTDWLTTDAPVVSGETITLDLTVFDVSDHTLDSLIVLDNFRWSSLPATVNTHE